MTVVIRVDPTRPDVDALRPAAERLRAGGLVAFPTETVYGLGAHALDRDAVQRVFDAKGRPTSDPLIVHIARLESLDPLVTRIPDAARTLAARFWPGPLTLVMPKSATVPDLVTAGLGTVAVRMPSHPVARALLELADVPVAAPSANQFSRPSPTRAAHVLDDLRNRIDIVVDGGATTVGIESTVLDLTGDAPMILRPGAIEIDAIREVLPQAILGERLAAGEGHEGAMPSPGLLAKHYSPRTPMTLYEGARAVEAIVTETRQARDRGQKIGILAADEDRRVLNGATDVENGPPPTIVTVGSADEPDQVAARLYSALRELDSAGVDLILARGFPVRSGLGLAIQDRLRRAAGNRIAT